jgi:hypothetical protein
MAEAVVCTVQLSSVAPTVSQALPLVRYTRLTDDAPSLVTHAARHKEVLTFANNSRKKSEKRE